MVSKSNVEDSKKGRSIAKFGDDPLTVMAKQVGLDPSKLKKILKATIIRPIKADEANKIEAREATDEELTVFLMVANKYHLNPILKEIYAFPDKKSGAIIPIVSTDGWNNLMLSNPKYKTHKYNYSEKLVTHAGARPCPEWIECIIYRVVTKPILDHEGKAMKDGNGKVSVYREESEVAVREYLDECYRSFKTPGPWQTHTKRMLRHKVKIQAAREALGFSDIYDRDEAERIVEAKESDLAAEVGYKAGVFMPEEKAAIGSGEVVSEQQEEDSHTEGELQPPPIEDDDDRDPSEDKAIPVNAELVSGTGYAPNPDVRKGQLDSILTDEEKKAASINDLKNRVAGMGKTAVNDSKTQAAGAGKTPANAKIGGKANEFFLLLKADLGSNMPMVKEQLIRYTGKESFYELSEAEAQTAYDMYMIHGPKDNPEK